MAELKLPELGENITQGTVTKILVKSGDTIKKGQNILELETDKAVLEVPSSSDGVIGEILIKSGAVVKVGQPIFTLSSETASPTPGGQPGDMFKSEQQKNVSPSRLPTNEGLQVKAPQENHRQRQTTNPPPASQR